MERRTGLEPVPSAWKADMLTIEHQCRVVKVFEYFILVKNMKNTKFRSIHGQGPFFTLYRISLTSPVMIVTGLLGYWHILPVYFAIVIPWMSSSSGQDSLTNAALLPRANQSSCLCRWEPPLYIGCRTTCVPLDEPRLICCHITTRILPVQ